MIYQRSSTTFELINLDEGGSGSGSNANTVTIADENSDRQRKVSRKQKHRHSKATISSLSNYKDAGSDFENSPEKQSDFQFKQNKNDENNSFVRLSKKLRQQNFINLNEKPETYVTLKNFDQVPTNSFQQLNYPYYGALANPNNASCSQHFDAFDPITTTTTSISEMIADDYDNEDDDSFAIFKTIKNDTLHQNYYTNHYRSQQQKQNRKKKININFDENDKYDKDEQNLLSGTYNCNSSVMSDNLDELEQYERDDQLGEMMPKDFGRKNRRVCYFY